VDSQHTATHCNTLQHTATHKAHGHAKHLYSYAIVPSSHSHCNTLHHTATRYRPLTLCWLPCGACLWVTWPCGSAFSFSCSLLFPPRRASSCTRTTCSTVTRSCSKNKVCICACVCVCVSVCMRACVCLCIYMQELLAQPWLDLAWITRCACVYACVCVYW